MLLIVCWMSQMSGWCRGSDGRKLARFRAETEFHLGLLLILWWFCRDCAWRSSCWPFSRRLFRLCPSPSPSAWSSTSPRTIWYGPSWTAWQPTSTTSDRNPPAPEGLYQTTFDTFQWDSNDFSDLSETLSVSEWRCNNKQTHFSSELAFLV